MVAGFSAQCANLGVLRMGNSGESGETAHATVCTPDTVAGCITCTASFFMYPSPSDVTCLLSSVHRMTGLYSV